MISVLFTLSSLQLVSHIDHVLHNLQKCGGLHFEVSALILNTLHKILNSDTPFKLLTFHVLNNQSLQMLHSFSENVNWNAAFWHYGSFRLSRASCDWLDLSLILGICSLLISHFN
jgi:hypothetical protein